MIGDLDSYNYEYPGRPSGLKPIANKDQANMLVYEKNNFSHKKVSDLLKYVSKNDLLVLIIRGSCHAG